MHVKALACLKHHRVIMDSDVNERHLLKSDFPKTFFQSVLSETELLRCSREDGIVNVKRSLACQLGWFAGLKTFTPVKVTLIVCARDGLQLEN